MITSQVLNAENASTAITDSDCIVWDSSVSLPGNDAINHLGLGGVYSGFVNGKLLIAGGSNFPFRTDTERGDKFYWSDIYVQDGDQWHIFSDILPSPSAHGFSIQVPDGLLCIGGNNSTKCHDDVFIISLDSDNTPKIHTLPSMPFPLTEMAGGCIGSKVYIAGGHTSVSNPISQNILLSFDLKTHKWEELKPWNGEARSILVGAVQSDGIDNCLYIFGGRNFKDGKQWDDVSDCWKYNPRLGTWSQIDGDFPITGGSATALGANHILLAGGTHRNIGTQNKVRLFHTITNTVIEHEVDGALIPISTSLAKNDKEFYITSGEQAPAVRTPVILKGSLKSTINRISIIDILVIILYFITLSWIGVYFSKRQKSADDFIKGGGRVPWIIVGLSIFGTNLSAITFMSIPAKAYATDWSYMFFSAGIILVVPVITMLFIPFFKKLNITTAYEYLEQRFNPFIRTVCSLAFIIFQVGRMGIVLLLPSIALNVVTGFDIFTCIAIMGILSLIYTYLGGIEAVAWTGALQVVILMGAALIVLLTISLSLPEGFGQIIDIARADNKMNLGSMHFDLRQTTFWTVLIATVFTNITTYGTDQTIVQRYILTDTEQKAKKGVYTNAALTIPAILIFFFLGTAMYAWFKVNPNELSASITDADAILPWYVNIHMPSGIQGLVIAGIFAAAMSTLSSNINSAATAWVVDIHPLFKRNFDRLKIVKTATIIAGIVGIVFALMMATWDIKSLWDEFSKILGILLGGLGGLFLLGMLSKKANSTGATCGIIASMIAQFIVIQNQSVNLLLYSSVGFITCFVIGWIVSIITGGPKKNIEHLTVGSLMKR